MEADFSKMDLDQLIDLYCRADEELNRALLNGALWEEVLDKRAEVTKLAQVIYQKRQIKGNQTPADTQIRCDD